MLQHLEDYLNPDRSFNLNWLPMAGTGASGSLYAAARDRRGGQAAPGTQAIIGKAGLNRIWTSVE